MHNIMDYIVLFCIKTTTYLCVTKLDLTEESISGNIFNSLFVNKCVPAHSLIDINIFVLYMYDYIINHLYLQFCYTLL